MAWYGPSGECGCCDQAGACQCPPVCECVDPENAGKSLIGKRFTISGFPAVIELKISSYDLGSSKYIDQYYFVSGLDKFNGTYDMRLAGFAGFEPPNRCDYEFTKFEDVYVQVYKTTDPAQGSATKCGAGLTQIFDGFETLALYVNAGGGWSICTKQFSVFDHTFSSPCYLGDFNVTTTLSGWYIAPTNNCGPQSTSIVSYLMISGSPTPFAFPPFGTVVPCLNNSYVFQIDYSIESITKDFRDISVSGWNFEVSEIKAPTYARDSYGPIGTECFLINGLDELNGMYFLPNILSKCKPNSFTEEVPITWQKLLISTSSPCTIVETSDTGTGTGKLSFISNELGTIIDLRVIISNPYGTGDVELLIGGSTYFNLACLQDCISQPELEECFPTYNQTIFKACWAPELS